MRTPMVVVMLMALAGTAMGTGVQPPPVSHAVPAQPAAAAPAVAPAPAASSATMAAPVALRVRGVGLKDMDLSMADLKAMPHRTITVKDKDDVTVAYSGVTVEDILAKAGMAFGHSLRGPKLRDYLLAESADGYGVVFALPEISTEFSDRLVIIADAAGDKPLAEREGPLKVIVSDEKKHARWARGVAGLRVMAGAGEKK